MQRILILIIIVFIVVAFMTTYTVRFTENAVVTTFGKAGEKSVKTEAGLKFTVPYVQNITKYDRRARYLESKPETQQTADASQVVVTAYVTWRIADPKLFYQTFSGAGDRAISHYRAAEKMVGDQLRPAMGEVSKFRFDQLLSASAGGSELGDCEIAMLRRLKGETAAPPSPTTPPSAAPPAASKPGAPQGSFSPLAAAGIEPLSIGIISIELPEETTKAVFARMTQSRVRIAEDARSQGAATAETIRQNADSDAKKIMAFAERRADSIRALGDVEAAPFLAKMKEQPELAVFMKNMDLLRQAYATKITLVIPAGPTGWPGFELARPDALKDLKPGQIPAPNIGNLSGAAPKADASQGGAPAAPATRAGRE